MAFQHLQPTKAIQPIVTPTKRCSNKCKSALGES